MSESKNYEKEIKVLRTHAREKVRELEGDLRVFVQANRSYYQGVFEILEETIKKLREL